MSWKKQLDKYLKGYHLVVEAAQNLKFKVFLGIEIKFNNDPNEYLVYGLDQDFHEYEDLAMGGIVTAETPANMSELILLLKSGDYI